MRSSPAAIAIQLLQSVPGLLAVILLWSTAGARLHGWVALVVEVAFWAYVVLRPASIPLLWLATSWDVTEQGVRLRHGLLAREVTDVGWAEVVSFDVSQPWLHRVFGCHALRFGLGTTQKAAVHIDAVSGTTLDRIVELARSAQLTPPQPEPPASREAANPTALAIGTAPATATVPTSDASHWTPATAAGAPAAAPAPADREIYRIRPRDYGLISVAYGSFVLLVPAALSVVDQAAEWLPLPLPDPTLVLRWPLGAQLAAGVAVLALSVAYGWLFTWLRYRHFRVIRTGDGYLTSGGLLSTQTRTVTAARVRGLKVTQNPTMRVLGYARVSVLTSDAGDQPMANLLFPLVRLAELPAALGPELPVPAGVGGPPLRLSTPARACLLIGVGAAWAALVAVAYLVRPDSILVTGTAATLVLALVTNACWVVATTLPDRDVCYVRRGLFWVSHVEFATSAVQVVQSSQGPFGRLTRTWSVVLHYYDGRIRRVRALGCSAARRHALTGPVLGDAPLADAPLADAPLAVPGPA